MKLRLNSDDEHYASLWHYARILERMGLRDDTSDIVLNICSIASKHMARGKCTIYIEGDDFCLRGTNKDLYNQADILYIYTKKYLHFYPAKTKLITGYFDPDWHYPRDVVKTHDYSFIASTRGDPVYDNRRETIERLQKSKFAFFIAECSPEQYPEYLSRGRIILNILPRSKDGDASPNNRIFEGIACGCLMNDRDEVLDDLGLIPNIHYLPLERFGEDFKDEELAKIHEAGRKYICENFSYQQAIKTIIKDVEEYLGTLPSPKD
jgi:hypothetical protein